MSDLRKTASRSLLNRAFAVSLMTVAASVVIPVHHAWAQSADDEDEAEAQADAEAAAKKSEARRAARAAAPPDALPGARSSDEDNSRSNTDLEPTAALFDAIDHGSLSAARDAVNRGADLEQKNVLGQTPLDASIDLNRNDITFFLLSMRSLEPDTGVMTASTSHGSVKVSNGSGHINIGGRSSVGPTHPAVRRHIGGGTPAPAEGFLGFDGS
ncbi:ankyrin repeat domain-containing protein [Acetobacter sp. AN02]|uniref:ankyrin repeat domain-containing protein n=1 Tax=Acetobacter sp. AN02 TaxID=2894186 RepID=UPI0024344E76|nr:ankyrin repeat domain-containing protein [Acetobacter sp. AN02]MDG6094426.1 ankyrin repeat domain-containing protein [Acetobacter sp. AN02]